MEETANAAMKSAIVIALSRWVVSQVICRACSQVRAPVAPAAAAIAHAPHMPAIVRMRGVRLPTSSGTRTKLGVDYVKAGLSRTGPSVRVVADKTTRDLTCGLTIDLEFQPVKRKAEPLSKGKLCERTSRLR
jgi:hypothetical protein